jgi:two-component system, NtrC family, sensor kinase
VRGLLGNAVQEFAHEMRNPMSYLLANLDFLESATDPAAAGGTSVPLAELTEVVRDARLGVDRMRSVLAWFLELHQDDRVPAAAYDLNAEIRNTLNFYERKWAERIQVHVDLGEVPIFRVRGKQLNQVFVNLVTNASQAMPTGNLWITTRYHDGLIVLQVKDDGPGILPGHLTKIFERGVTTKPGVGSGLGLYITKAIVERHGGRISVRSEPGHGATFEVEIPERSSET